VTLTNRCLLEGSTEDFFGFKHRGMMEYYCGWYLGHNQEKTWIERAKVTKSAKSAHTPPAKPPIRCGEKNLRRVVGDENWNWAFRFAHRTGPSIPRDERDVLVASLSELFLPREEGAGRRPTELIYRAWHLFELDRLLLREKGLTEAQGRDLILPTRTQSWLITVAERALQRSTNCLKAGFARCPKQKEDDGKPFLDGSPEGEGQENEHRRFWSKSSPSRCRALRCDSGGSIGCSIPEHERIEAEDFQTL